MSEPISFTATELDEALSRYGLDSRALKRHLSTTINKTDIEVALAAALFAASLGGGFTMDKLETIVDELAV